MKKPEQKNRIASIQAYLLGLGFNINNVQAYEILARAHGYRNKQAFAAASKPVVNPAPAATSQAVIIEGVAYEVLLPSAAPFSVAEMEARNWTFNVLVPVDPDVLGDTEAFNDCVSEYITGCDCALEGIGFKIHPEVVLADGHVTFRVSAVCTSPNTWFDEYEAQRDKAGKAVGACEAL